MCFGVTKVSPQITDAFDGLHFEGEPKFAYTVWDWHELNMHLFIVCYDQNCPIKALYRKP